LQTAAYVAPGGAEKIGETPRRRYFCVREIGPGPYFCKKLEQAIISAQ